MLSNEPRTVDEGYASACASSDLRVEADRNGDADYVIAAGMNQSRFGALLLRLVTEWDRAEKPKRPTPAFVEALARTYRYASVRECLDAARIEAFGWYARELEVLAAKMKTLPQARRELALHAQKLGIPGGDAVAPAILGWWLMQQCPVCLGVKEQAIPGTGRLSGKLCRTCQGSGVSQVPHGAEGRKLANHLDYCVARARIDIKNRLRKFSRN